MTSHTHQTAPTQFVEAKGLIAQTLAIKAYTALFGLHAGLVQLYPG